MSVLTETSESTLYTFHLMQRQVRAAKRPSCTNVANLQPTKVCPRKKNIVAKFPYSKPESHEVQYHASILGIWKLGLWSTWSNTRIKHT